MRRSQNPRRVARIKTEMLEKKVKWRGDLVLLRLDHICYDQCRRLHPLWIACYADEDMVGKLKLMAVDATPRQMVRQVLRRYAAYVCVRWQRQLQE